MISEAAEKGIYVALVPVWGSVVKSDRISTKNKQKFMRTFLANRYKSHTNIIWMNGGDIQGSDSTKSVEYNRLYHPSNRPRTPYLLFIRAEGQRRLPGSITNHVA